MTWEYRTTYRGLDFLTVVWFGSSLTPILSARCLSFSVFVVSPVELIGSGGGVKSNDGEKAWSSINHFVLSGLVLTYKSRETERGGPCRPIATEVNRDSRSTYNGVLDFYFFFSHIYRMFTIDSYSNIWRTALELLDARFKFKLVYKIKEAAHLPLSVYVLEFCPTKTMQSYALLIVLERVS